MFTTFYKVEYAVKTLNCEIVLSPHVIGKPFYLKPLRFSCVDKLLLIPAEKHFILNT